MEKKEIFKDYSFSYYLSLFYSTSSRTKHMENRAWEDYFSFYYIKYSFC